MEIKLHQDIAIVTVIGGDNLTCSLPGQKKIFTSKGEGLTGCLNLPWLEEQVAGLIRGNQSTGFNVACLSNPEEPEQKVTVMIDPYLPPNELIILGGGHIALPLVKMGKMLGYQVTVIDDRQEFVSAERFPDADRVICRGFNDLGRYLALGPGSSVVIVTRGHQHDQECLRQLINYPLAYLGMIGSKRKIKMARQNLLEEGIDLKIIDKVHMPVGLDIGAQTPEEIAICIAAEMIRNRRGGSLNSLKDSPSQEDARKKDSEISSAVDKEVLKKALRAACDGTPAALATIIKTSGSTPRKAGARMFIHGDGRTFGTIGGGNGESEVRLVALEVIDELSPRLHQVNMTADLAALEGMVCGGMMEVFIEPVNTFRAISGGEILEYE